MAARRLALALVLAAAALPAEADDTSLVFLPDGGLVAQYGGLINARFAVLGRDGEAPAADDLAFWGPALDITAAAANADARRFAVSTRDGRVLVLGADGGTLAETRLGKSRVRAVALSTDGALVAAGGNGGEIAAWRIVERGGAFVLDRVAEGKSGDGDILRVVFAPGDGAVLATDGRVFAAMSLASRAVATLKGRAIADLAAGGAGAPVLYEADRGFRRYDPAKNAVTPFGPPIKLGAGGTFAISPKGDLVAALEGAGTLTLIGADGRVRARWPGAANNPTRDGETTRGLLVFSPDGRSLAVLGGDGALALWTLDAGALARPNAPPPKPRALGAGWRGTFGEGAVMFRADGRLLVLAPLSSRRVAWGPDGARRGETVTLRAGAEGPLLALADGTLARGEKSGRLVVRDGAGARTVAAHAGGVTALAATRDGALLASGGGDEAVRLWRRDLTPVAAIPAAHFGDVAALAFAPDGQRFASGGADGALRFWRADGSALGAPVEATSERISVVAAAPGGDVLAVGDNKGRVRLWSWDGKPAGPAFRADAETVYAILFLPDGASLLVSGQTGLRRWSRDGKAIGEPLSGGSGAIALVPGGAPDGAPDGATVAHLSVRFADRGVVRFWRLADGAPARTPLVDLPAPPTALAFAPDGAWLAIGDDAGLVRRWAPGAGAPALVPTSHAASIVTILPVAGPAPSGGPAPGFVSVDRAGGFVFWTAADLVPVRSFAVAHDYLFSLAAAPDSATVATGDRDGTIRVIAPDGKVRWAWRPEGDNAVTGLAFAGANEIVARLFGRAGDVHWFALDGTRSRRPNETRLGRLHALAYAPATRRLAFALESDAGYALLGVGAAGAELPPLARHRGGGFPAVAAAPDGTVFAFGDDAGGVHLVGADGAIRRPAWKAHQGAVRALAFAPNGQRLASIGEDGAIRLWSLDGQRLHETGFAP
jgi:WD40 repeat protein